MLASQNTGSDFAASALADGPETPKAPATDAAKGQPAQRSYFARSTEQKQAPLPDLPARQSYLSSGSTQPPRDKPITFTSTPSLTKEDAKNAEAWVAHSDGRTDNIKSAPELKSALPAKVEQSLSEREAQYAASNSPLAKDLAQVNAQGASIVRCHMHGEYIVVSCACVPSQVPTCSLSQSAIQKQPC